MSTAAIYQASMNAAKWGYGGAVIKIIAQTIAQIFIARQLGPDQFGVFAIATIVISLANFFTDLGMSLVQKKEISESDIRHTFTIQVLIGLVCSAISFFSAGPLASLLTDHRAEAVIKALSLVLLLNAASAVSMNLLRRELDFRSIQVAQISSYVIGFLIVGVTLAFLGAGVWSLVFAWIVQSLLNLLLLYNKARHPCRLLFSASGQSDSHIFNATALFTNIANWAVANIPRIIISRAFQTLAVGLYSMTFNLLMAPLQHILSTLQQVLFSSSAKLQGNNDALTKIFLSLCGGIGFVTFPLFFAVSLMSGDVILALYGPAWLGASDVLRPLALSMPMLLLMGCATPILWGVGKVSSELWAQIFTVVVLSVAVYSVTNYHLGIVSWAIALVLCGRSILLLYVACKLLQIGLFRFLRTLAPGILVTVIVCLQIAISNLFLWQVITQPFLRLTINFVAVLGLIIFLMRFPVLFNREVNSLLKKISSEMPVSMRFLLNRPGGDS